MVLNGIAKMADVLEIDTKNLSKLKLRRIGGIVYYKKVSLKRKVVAVFRVTDIIIYVRVFISNEGVIFSICQFLFWNEFICHRC